MNESFDRDIALLLDRLEPPALSPGFADRIVPLAEAAPTGRPLPKLRRPRPARRRVALAVGIAGLLSVAAAAAVVPTRVWRELPVIGAIVELIAPSKPSASAPADERQPEAVLPPAPVRMEPAAAPASPPPQTAEPLAPRQAPAAQAGEDKAAIASPPARLDPARPVPESVPVERTRETLPEAVRERPTIEPERGRTLFEPIPAAPEPAPAPVRTITPERIAPAETRQIIRETSTPPREAAPRERIQPAPRPAPVERTPREPAGRTRN